jgi:hypothetical protein
MIFIVLMTFDVRYWLDLDINIPHIVSIKKVNKKDQVLSCAGMDCYMNDCHG